MRAFIAAVHLCAAVYIGAVMYRPAPVVAAPVKIASWLKADKLQGQVKNPPWPEKIVQVEVIPPRIAKLSEPVRLLWPCALMRLAVEKFGRDAVRKALRESRTTKAEIDEAMTCLTKGERS